MSRKRRIEVETAEADETSGEPESDGSEGWESLAEEAEGGRLAASPELEAALREAAEAVPDPEPRAQAEPSAELQQAQERFLRVLADFENFRRRAERERNEASQYGHQNLVKELLPTVDNLDRAIEHARQSGGGDLESLLHGVELVQRELLSVLHKHGVKVVEAVAKPFDPALHEAMAQVPDGSVPPNTIVEEFQKGYQLRDRLLRPSRVVVSRAPDAEAAAGPDDEKAQAEAGSAEAEQDGEPSG